MCGCGETIRRRRRRSEIKVGDKEKKKEKEPADAQEQNQIGLCVNDDVGSKNTEVSGNDALVAARFVKGDVVCCLDANEVWCRVDVLDAVLEIETVNGDKG